MNSDIKLTVELSPTLALQENKGQRYRIMREDVRKGSLWVTPRRNGFCIVLTGEVEVLMYNFMCKHFGSETGVDQNRKYWNIANIGDVTKIIKRFAEK